jgi:hypothetical protein
MSFISIVPKYLNFATFSDDSLAVLIFCRHYVLPVSCNAGAELEEVLFVTNPEVAPRIVIHAVF